MTTKTSKQPATVTTVQTIGKGSILSETSFYKVKDIQTISGNLVYIVEDDSGHEIRLGKNYVDEILISADLYTSTEEKTMTELAELFIKSPRVAMSVCYVTKATEKTKKAYEAEKQEAINRIQNATLANTASLVNDLIENPITRFTPGHERVMKGRHYGHVDDLGRVHFIDMELAKEPGKDYDSRSRQVDPRTIQWLVINKVKYVLKH